MLHGTMSIPLAPPQPPLVIAPDPLALVVKQQGELLVRLEAWKNCQENLNVCLLKYHKKFEEKLEELCKPQEHARLTSSKSREYDALSDTPSVVNAPEGGAEDQHILVSDSEAPVRQQASGHFRDLPWVHTPCSGDGTEPGSITAERSWTQWSQRSESPMVRMPSNSDMLGRRSRRRTRSVCGSVPSTGTKTHAWTQSRGIKLPTMRSFLSLRSNRKAEEYIIKQKIIELEDNQSALLRITRSKRFEAFITVAILTNSVVIGVQVQAMALATKDAYEAGDDYEFGKMDIFSILQLAFTVLFVIELVMRWTAEGLCGFLTTFGAKWNVFDLTCVLVGVVESVIEIIMPVSMTNGSVVRCLRSLRLVRLIRAIRIYPFFHELRMMVDSCLCGLKSYMWCCVVLFILLYIFGITMTTGTILWLHESGSHDAPETMAFFGTLDVSMLSLFQTITGGRDWCEFWTVIDPLGGLYHGLFVLYVTFAVFVVLNAVAAVFVESAMQSSQRDRELLIREKLKDRDNYHRQMRNVFLEMDNDGTGTITLDEFERHLDDDRVKAYFDTLKLDVSDAKSLFLLLDEDRSGSVDIDEFITGCQELKGESRRLDMRLIQYEVTVARHYLEGLFRYFKVPFRYSSEEGDHSRGSECPSPAVKEEAGSDSPFPGLVPRSEASNDLRHLS